MHKTYELIKIERLRTIAVIVIITVLLISCTSFTVRADNVYEYYFVPNKSTENADQTQGISTDFFESLPDELKELLPDSFVGGNTEEIVLEAKNITDFSSIWKKLISEISDVLFPALTSAAIIFGIILLSALLKMFNTALSGTGTGKTVDTLISIGIIIAIVNTELVSFNTVEQFKRLICNLMNGMVPALGVVYAASGNVSTAAVQSGGVMLLVTLCQNLFTVILMPSVRICMLLSIVGAVFPDVGIKPITAAFKNIATSIMLASATLFSFVLGLQNTIAQSADSFGARSIKFAIGNLVPIIGGAVSDSLGTIGGSLEVLKSAGGSAAIITIILILVPTLVALLVRRFSIFLCKSTAGILGCTEEEKLLSELGSVTSMMLAFSVAISIAFIYTLTLFTGSALAATS